ncbi:MAG: type II secretion system F family protein [Candidatus Dormibacteria bacterium]
MTHAIVLAPPTPLQFFAEVMLLLVLGCAAFWVVAGVDGLALAGGIRRRAEPFRERERDVAAGLGWSARTWAWARVAAVGAGILAGLSTGIPIAVVGGLLGGLFAFPWALAARAERRRLRTERAFVAMVREVRDRMLANTAFDQALRDIADTAPAELREVLSPLAGDAPMAEALVEVERRARSPLATMICLAFMLSRTRNQAALVDLLSDTLLPAATAALGIETEADVTATQQRTIVYIMLLIEGGSLWYVSSVPTFHQFYANVLGQLTLVVIAVMFLGLTWVVGRMLRRPAWTRWDMESVRGEFEGAGLA